VKRYYLLSSSTFTKKVVRSSLEGNLAPNILTVGGFFFFGDLHCSLYQSFPSFGFQVPYLRSSRKNVLFFLFFFFFHHHDDVLMFFFICSYLVSRYAPRLGLSFKYVSCVLFVMASGMKLFNEVVFLFIYLLSLVQGNEVVLWQGGLLYGGAPGQDWYTIPVLKIPLLFCFRKIIVPSCVNRIEKRNQKN